MSITGSCLVAAIKTFGVLPFARAAYRSMILTFQGHGLRKHPWVSLGDLLST